MDNQLILEALRNDIERSEKAAARQKAVWLKEKPDKHPLLLCCPLSGLDEPNTKETHYNSEKMLRSGLIGAMAAVRGGADAVPSIRANMGCGIFATLFGIKQELFDDKMPWVLEHLTKDDLYRMTAADLKIGEEFTAALEHIHYMADAVKGTACRIFPPDLQGAFDTAHIVYGDDIFYDLYDDPGFIHHLMDLSCHAIFMGMDAALEAMDIKDGLIPHYSSLVMPRSLGGVKISEDTSTLVSKEHINEFVLPYLDRILNYYGGGYIHYCGVNDALFDGLLSLEKVYGLNFGDPQKMDMPYHLSRIAGAGKLYFGHCGKMDGEGYEEYFRRVCGPATDDDGNLRLLLSISCRAEERDGIFDAWSKGHC